MSKISVVIITLNAAQHLDQVLSKAEEVSDDIVVVDSGSTDRTETICQTHKVRFYKQVWQGYGPQKNKANSLAKNEWVLSLDGDEVMTDKLVHEIQSLPLAQNTVYEIPFRNFYAGKVIKFGRWRGERHVRLFPKSKVEWNENAVHEGLHISQLEVESLQHKIIHYSMADKEEHLSKAKKYARMGAIRLHEANKKSTFLKRYINPIFRFIMDYFIFLGFLDGSLGFQIALITAKETYWKYKHLKALS